MTPKGPIAWIAANHVAANLLMFFLIVGGLITFTSMKTEVFPNIEVDTVVISVSYSGATPEEVTEGVILVLEDAVSSVEWAEKVTATAREGSGSVVVELVEGSDRQQAYQDIKAEVDRITTLPDEADDPVVSLASRKRSVVDITVYGELPSMELRHYTDSFRQELLSHKDITLVDYSYGAKDREIRIKIPEQTLRKYGLTLSQVASVINSASLDLPAGSIERGAGELVLRMKDKRYYASDYGDIPVVTGSDSGVVLLRDMAEIVEGFEDADVIETFNGMEGMTLRVYRVGDQTPDSIASAIYEIIDSYKLKIPEAVNITVWDDDSKLLKSRLDLLKRNALLGLALVLVILAVFLEFRLAVWVAMGIPISFAGAAMLLPHLGVSINMISSFAFILALGIVVDDAIVVGENIYAHRMMGKSKYRAAVDGTHEVLGAVTFSVLTTVVAFVPLLFIEGMLKTLMSVIPFVVISVLLISLVESFFILPAHLNSRERGEERGFKFPSLGIRRHIRGVLDYYINNIYGAAMKYIINYRYITIAVFTGALIVTFGYIKSGNLKFIFMPKVERDVIRVTIDMPVGSNVQKLQDVVKHIESSARRVDGKLMQKTGADKSYIDFIISGSGSSSAGRVAVGLTSSEERDVTTSEFQSMLRKAVGRVHTAEAIKYTSSSFRFGENLDIRYAHADEEVLRRVADEMKAKLGTYDGVIDIKDSFEEGKTELKFKVNELGKKHGLTNGDISAQVRAAFYGVSALKFQRGLDEVTVRVEYPDDEKTTVENLMNMYIKTSSGREFPFYKVAEAEYGRGLSIIKRTDRLQIINVRASAEGAANPAEVMNDLISEFLPDQMARYGGLAWKFEGEEERKQQAFDGIIDFMPIAMLIMYALLAIPFKSYVQPILVLIAIPFGLTGAVWGHMLLGMNLSILSVFGMVAVAGVVVNDSLVLVDFTNKYVEKGKLSVETVIEAGKRRFRPILMTSLTTFFGLMPMMLEKSIQAKFLIPMAVSLAFGVLFTTFVALIFVPCIYMALEDIKKIYK